MLEPDDIMKVLAVSFAAADVAQSKERYGSADDAIKKAVENFGIIYEKMRENKSDIKIEHVFHLVDGDK